MRESITNRLVSGLKPKDKPYEIWDTTLKGLILRVEPSGSMTYYLQYRNSERARKRIKLGRADALAPFKARESAKEQLAKVYKGEDPAEEKKQVKLNDYLQFLNETYKPFLNANLRKGVNNAENVKETMDRLTVGFPEFHQLALSEITSLLVEKWRQRRNADGVKPATINRQMNDLRACLNRAVEWGLLVDNPLMRVKPSKTDSNAKVRYLTSIEESRLREALDARENRVKDARARANEWRADRNYEMYTTLSDEAFADYLKPAVLLSLNTGLRRGELFSLKWTDINFEQRNLTVEGDLSKAGKTRHIPLNEEALTILKSWKQQPGIKSQFVFHGRDGQPLQNLRKSFVAILKDAMIQDFRWHDIRHSFASKLVMAGVDLNTVRELLGHSDYKMTLRYAHLGPEHKAAAVARLNPQPAGKDNSSRVQ